MESASQTRAPSATWNSPCPRCGREATCRPRPDTTHHAELRCPACNHFRWLAAPPPEAVGCGFTVIIDTREQQPYGFGGLRGNKVKGHSPLLVVPTVRGTLRTGDYSIDGLAERTTIERKSKSDLYSSISESRENFAGRLRRMESYESSVVVVEASWRELLTDPPRYRNRGSRTTKTSGLTPKSLCRTIQSWMIEFPRTHWLMVENREYAEAFTFRLLQRFWINTRGDGDGTPDATRMADRE